MAAKQLEAVKFDSILYANCWEDADVLLSALRPGPGSSVISIASAGDNCFSLLTANPDRVVAVDVSPVQLYLTELKIQAIKALDRTAYMEFAGFLESKNRAATFSELSGSLSKECRNYWSSCPEIIEEGIIHCGKFERYFQLFRRDYFEKVHNPSMIVELFRRKSEADQQKWHDEVWNTSDWVKLYKHFFGEQMMGSHGREAEFLKQVQGSVADMMFDRAAEHLRSTRCQSNYFLYYILNNRFSGNFLPHYVRQREYDKVRRNLDKLHLRKGFIDDVCKEEGPFTHYNLSDIFEYMDSSTFKSVSDKLISGAAPKARFAYWNLMVPRRISQINDVMSRNADLSKELKEADPGYFYQDFIVDELK
jgi:S-adenosylmethionine-diacylglycerol 3-amino-3-carboxypropyl transferase